MDDLHSLWMIYMVDLHSLWLIYIVLFSHLKKNKLDQDFNIGALNMYLFIFRKYYTEQWCEVDPNRPYATGGREEESIKTETV